MSNIFRRQSYIAILCVISLLACCFVVPPAAAAGEVTLTVGTVPAASTDAIVTIPITANKVGDIVSFGFKIDYDRTKLEFAGWDATGTVLESLWPAITKSNTTDVNTNLLKPAVGYANGDNLPISDENVSGVSGEGILAKIKFKVLAAGANITIPVRLSATPGEVTVGDDTSSKTVTKVDGGLLASAPELVSANVTSTGDVELTFDKDMADPAGNEASFTIRREDGITRAVGTVQLKTGDDKTIELILSPTKIAGGEVYQVRYEKAPVGPVTAADGGVLESFNYTSITNDLPHPTLDTINLPPAGTEGTPYSHTFIATGGTSPYTFYEETTPSWHPGLILSTSGVLSGTPTATGTYKVYVKVYDSTSAVDKHEYTFTVNEAEDFNITDADLDWDNLRIELTFSEGVYNESDGALAKDDFTVSFNKNTGGSMTNADIDYIKGPDGAVATGGETSLLLYLTLSNPPPSGVETIEIKPAADSIFNAAGTAMSTDATSGVLTFPDKKAPEFIWGFPYTTIGSASSKTVNLSINSPEKVNAYWTVIANDAAAPAAADVINGVTGAFINGNQPNIGNGVIISVPLVLPDHDTDYDVYVVITDQAGNPKGPVKLDIKTPEELLTTINIAAISGITSPVRGATPVTAITETAQYTGTVSWSPNDATFAASTVYTATITLAPKAGYTLTGVAENFFTVAGATTVSNSANLGVVTAVFPATAAVPVPTITNASLDWTNGRVQIWFSEGVYANSNGTGGLAVNGSDFAVTFNSNGGTMTNATFNSVRTTGNGDPIGGETSLFLCWSLTNGPPSGVETIEIKPAADSIFNAEGTTMATSQTSGVLTFPDKKAPEFAEGYPKQGPAYSAGHLIVRLAIMPLEDNIKAYSVILENESPAPTINEVIAGTGNTGNPAIVDDTAYPIGTMGYTLNAVLPALSTNYYAYVVLEDTAGNKTLSGAVLLTTPPAASSDTTITGVTVDGVAATVDTNDSTVYKVELPVGTVLADLTAADIAVTANDSNATVGTPETIDGGATWTVVVTAEDGTTTKTYTINVTVEPTAATWNATGTFGINADKVDAGYQLMAGTEQIPLTDANIASIKVLNPDATITTLTPDTDPLLWFNVEKAAGDYVYTIVTEGGITYSATLTWQAPMTAIWSATGAEGVAPHNDYLYKEYQLMYNDNPISLADGEIDLIAFKDAGNWTELEPNTDTTLWFDKSKPSGDYEYLIANADGIYKATLAWTESPVLVTSINVSGTGGVTTMTDRLAGGELQMIADVLPANAANKEVTWSVASKGPEWSDVSPGQIGAGFAEIRADGLLYRGHTVGPVTVKATAKDGLEIYGETDITIIGVHMSYGGAGMLVDKTYQLAAQAVPADTTDFTWASSNEDVATVSDNGLVTSISVGSAIITATTADGRVGYCTITVTPKLPATMADLTISEGTLNPAFDPNIYDYTASVTNSITSVTISATKWGDMDVSGDIGTFDLLVGPNTFEIDVDGGADRVDATYTVVITRKSASTGGGGGGGALPGFAIPTEGTTHEEFDTIFEFPEDAVKYDTRGDLERFSSDKIDAPEDSFVTGFIYELTKKAEGDFLKPITVTLPYKQSAVDFEKYDLSIYWYDEDLDEWVELDDVTVDKGDLTVSGETKKTGYFALIAAKKTVQPVEPPVEPELPVLTDISGHWAKANIEYLVEMGAISGYPDNTFRPDNPITRAEFAVVLVKAFDLKAVNGKVFDDTASHWAKDYIATAAANGIVTGYSEMEFGPDDLITREQMAVMIVKAAKLSLLTGELNYSDKEDISDWASSYVVTAVQNELMKGYLDNSFKPLGNATRAEAVTVIYNALR